MATLTATPEPNAVPPRVLLELEYDGQDSAVITRADPDGTTSTVRTADPVALVGGMWTGYDYESWLNGTARYTAATAGGTVLSDVVSMAIPVVWLRHPGIPDRSIIVEIIPPLDERVHSVDQSVLQPLGREFPIVVSDGVRKAPSSTVTLRTETDDAAAAMRLILADVIPLLLDVPPTHGLGFTHAWISVGEVRERKFYPRYGPNPWRNFVLPYQVVGRPAGGLQAQRTWADVMDEAPTWAALQGMYATWEDVLTGRRTGGVTPPTSDATYDALVLTDDPVAYWKLDNTGTGLADLAPGAVHPATNLGAVPGTFLDGSGAVKFNGSGAYLEVANHEALSVATTGEFSFEAWMSPEVLTYPISQGDGDYIHWMGKCNSSPSDVVNAEYVARMYNRYPTIDPSRPNRISGYVFNLAGSPTNIKNLGAGSYFQDVITPGEWIHYVCTINVETGLIKVYRDGVLRDADLLSGYAVVPQHGTAPFRMGTANLASFFKGRLARVALYDHELTAQRIRAHYRHVVPPLTGTGKFVRHVGSASSHDSGTRLQITVGASGVPAGSTLLARVGHPFTTGGPTIVDGRSNVWVRDRSGSDDADTLRGSIFSCQVQDRLRPGDLIELRTSVAVPARAISVDEFDGLLFVSPPNVMNAANGVGTTPGSVLIADSTVADAVVHAMVVTNGPITDGFTHDDVHEMAPLAKAGTATGSGDITVTGAWKPTTAAGQQRWSPLLAVSRTWLEMIAVYAAGTPTVTPPVQGTASRVREVVAVNTAVPGASLVLTVPGPDPIVAGHTLVLSVSADYTAAAPTCVDDSGNAWTVDRSSPTPGNAARGAVMSCVVSSTLMPGDHITLTWSTSIVRKAVTLVEYAGVMIPKAVDVTNAASGATGSPSTTLTLTTTVTNTLLVGAVAMAGPRDVAFSGDATWTPLARAGTTGGVAVDNRTVYPAFRAVHAAGGYVFSPQLQGSYPWAVMLVAYRAG